MLKTERAGRRAFPGRLRQLRTDRAWSAAQLGKKAGLSARQVYRYEWGWSFPPPAPLKRLAKALRVSAAELAGFVPW